MLLTLYAFQNDYMQYFSNYLSVFFKDWSVSITTLLALIPIVLLYIILRALDIIPSLIDWEKMETAVLKRLARKKDGK